MTMSSPGLMSLLAPYAAAIDPQGAPLDPATDPLYAGVSSARRGLDSLVGQGSAPDGRGGVVGLGEQLAARQGWTGDQWKALYDLWQRESGWNTKADNPTSSAYGIPQMMTGVHDVSNRYMAGDPRAQISTGLRYIAQRYGSPLEAWHHSQQTGWY